MCSKAERISPIEESEKEGPGPEYKVVDVSKFKKRSVSIKFNSEKTGRTTLDVNDQGGEMYDVMPGYQKTIERVKVQSFSKEAKKSYVERIASKNKTPGIGHYKADKGFHLLSPSPTARRRL